MVCGMDLFAPDPAAVNNPDRRKPAIMKCDYDRGVHVLFHAIEKRRWAEVDQIFEETDRGVRAYGSQSDWPLAKLLAMTWVYRLDKDTGKVKWQITPLHAAVIYGAPPDVLVNVFEAYPGAIKLGDDQGNLPLHLAYRSGLLREKIDMLYRAYPRGAGAVNRQGYTPVECASFCVTTEEEKRERESEAVDRRREAALNYREYDPELAAKTKPKRAVQAQVQSSQRGQGGGILRNKKKYSGSSSKNNKKNNTVMILGEEEEQEPGVFQRAMNGFVGLFDGGGDACDYDTVCTDEMSDEGSEDFTRDDFTEATDITDELALGKNSNFNKMPQLNEGREFLEENKNQRDQTAAEFVEQTKREAAAKARAQKEKKQDGDDDDIVLNGYNPPIKTIDGGGAGDGDLSCAGCSAFSDITPGFPLSYGGNPKPLY